MPRFEKGEYQDLIYYAVELVSDHYLELITRATIEDLEAALILEAKNRSRDEQSNKSTCGESKG